MNTEADNETWRTCQTELAANRKTGALGGMGGLHLQGATTIAHLT